MENECGLNRPLFSACTSNVFHLYTVSSHSECVFFGSSTHTSLYKWLRLQEKQPVAFTQEQISQIVRRTETKIYLAKQIRGEQKHA